MTRTHAKYPTYLKDQRQFFDELITEDWDSYRSDAWDRSRRLEVDRLFARIAPRRVLDVGCGSGFHDRCMAEKPGVEAVVGIDYSARSVEAARKAHPHPKVTYVVADIFELEPQDVDLVVSFQVVEHLSDVDGFLRACARQVRPGGWVAAWTPNRLRLDNRLRRALRRGEVMLDPQHFAEYRPAELRACAEAAGLEFVATVGGAATLTIPRVGWRAPPEAVARRVGARRPVVASSFCGVFRVGGP